MVRNVIVRNELLVHKTDLTDLIVYPSLLHPCPAAE